LRDCQAAEVRGLLAFGTTRLIACSRGAFGMTQESNSADNQESKMKTHFILRQK
jgi:hypothetical protein